MTDILLIGLLLVLVGMAVSYMIKQKKRGAKCAGCPYAKNCCESNKSAAPGGKETCNTEKE